MSQVFWYCRPDEMYSVGAVVTTSGVDTTYSAQSLCGGWPGTPTRWAAAGAISGSLAFLAAGEVGLAAVCHHNLPGGTAITLGGEITATITTPATTPPNGIPLNAFTTLTPVTGVDAVTFAFNSGAVIPIIGELVLGKARTLTRPTMKTDQRGRLDFTRDVPSELSSIAPYRTGLAARAPWRGEFLLSTDDLAAVEAWFDAQLDGTRPSLIVPDAAVNDAWLGFLQAPQYRPIGPAMWRVQLTFVEIPRSRW